MVASLRNEEAEKKAATELEAQAEDGTEGANDELEQARKPPSHIQKDLTNIGWPWLRTYCSFQTKAKTLEGVISSISQCPLLREFQAESGKSCILTHIDLGESLGPGQRPLLRKKFVPEAALLKKLLHGAMIARNAQRKGDEAHCPAEGEVVMVHSGFRPRGQRHRGTFQTRNSP